MQKIFLSFFVILVFATCKRDVPVNIPKPDLEPLFGKWNWVETSGGLYGGGYSPASVGYSLAIQFNRDATCINFKNGNEVSTTYYMLTKGTSQLTGQPTTFINYVNPGSNNNNTNGFLKSLLFYGNDTLKINDEANDGFGALYVRSK